MSAQFWVVQHVADLFRNEPRNVGVIVQYEGNTFARFFGEDEDHKVDGRRIKALPYPDVYRQWVHYWRTHLGNIDSLVEVTKDHYRVSPGGQLTDLADSSPAQVSDHLYSILVSEGGIAEALSQGREGENNGVALEREIEQVLVERAALIPGGTDVPSHSVRRLALVKGRLATHTPAFSQTNGRLCVVETVDLTSPRRRTWRDHAGFVAYMFRDIHDETPNAERLTVIRATEEDRASAEGDYALRVLKNEGDLVDWLEPEQREAFVTERAMVAQH